MTRTSPVSPGSTCLVALAAALICVAGSGGDAEAQVCAQVKIEIVQELTLERQAFDAHMRITNGLTHVSIEELQVDVVFEDPSGNPVYATNDPNDTNALFFITLDSLSQVSAVDGSGTVAPEAVADIHWLIIPAPGSAGPDPDGTLYFVGADVSYSLGGEEHAVSVSPDSIYVRPMPLLFLDYFLTPQVNGDNPFTDAVEPPEPFTLGVRVDNQGYGPANKLKIESGQPKIIENDQGLLIAFEIIGSEVGNQPASTSLTVEFGDLLPSTAAVARWFMTSTLQGQFIAFDATFSHADELGGELTSLLEEVNTHWLIRDVLIDLPGRDDIEDFFADDPTGLVVYESDAVESFVFDASSVSTLQSMGGDVWRVLVPGTSGLSWVRLDDPYGGGKTLVKAVRADGKELPEANFWLSSVWHKANAPKDRHVNIFDTGNPTGLHYDLHYGGVANGNDAPVIGFAPNKKVRAGEDLGYAVNASDPDGTYPALSVTPLPAGAAFIDHEDGSGVLLWTPTEAQIGTYTVKLEAYDGALFDSKLVKIHVVAADEENSPPTAAAAAILTAKDTPSDPVTPTVVDPDAGDKHFFQILDGALYGSAEVIDNALVYTPGEGFTGSDSFTFWASDLFGEAVVGEAAVTVTGINDLVVSAMDLELNASGVPEVAQVVVENTGVEDLTNPIDISVRARNCGVDQVVGSVNMILAPGVTVVDVPLDMDGVVTPGQPVVMHAVADSGADMPEPDELNNALAQGLLMAGAAAKSMSLGTSGSTLTAACSQQALTVSGRTIFGLRSAPDDCYDLVAAGASVQYELRALQTGEVVRSGSDVADANGAWHVEFGLPSGIGKTYEMRTTVSDGASVDETRFTMTLEACAANTLPPMMVPEPPYTGPEGGDAIVSFQEADVPYPWLVHAGMPIVTSGLDGSGSFGAAHGTGSSTSVPAVGPAFGTTGGTAASFDAGLEAGDLTVVPAVPGAGQRVTFKAVVGANDSLYGLPVSWDVTTPSGETVTIAPTTWYYANGDLHAQATWVPQSVGNHTVEVSLGPEYSDADADNDSTSVEFGVTEGAPAFAGLTLWLEANQGVSTDASGTVFEWEDGSIAGIDAIQGTAARRPSLDIDPAQKMARVTFDGVDDYMEIGPGFADFSQGLTAFVVAQPTHRANSASVVELGADSSTRRIALGRSGGTDGLRYTVGKSTLTGTDMMDFAVPQVLAVTHGTDNKVTLWRDGEPVDAGVIRLPRAGERALNLIARSGVGGTGLFEGGVYAILVYDRVLGDEQRDAVALYLAETYGLYHPEAAWIAASGYGLAVSQLVHAHGWSKAEADAYEGWLAANPDQPVPGVGLELWLRADSGVAAGSGGAVASWGDRSSAAAKHDAIQTVSTAQPKVVDDVLAGHPVVRFDGSNDVLKVATGFADLGDGFSAFAVMRETGAARWASLIDLARASEGGRIALGRDAGGGDGIRFRAGAEVLDGNGGLASPSFRLVSTVHRAGGLATVYRQGVATAEANLGAPVDAVRDRNYIGQSQWDNIGRYKGEIAEVLVYRRALDGDQRSQVEAYLADRYGLYHPDATWIGAGGYGPEVVAAIHAQQWSETRADAWVAFLGKHGGAEPLPAESLELWLAADAGVTVSGLSILDWMDQSPAGSDASPLSAAQRPQLIDGDAWEYASFDGSNDGMSVAAGELGDVDTDGLAVHAVIRTTGLVGQTPLWEVGTTLAKDLVLFGTGDTPATLRYRAGAATVDAIGGLAPDRFMVVGVNHAADGTVTLTRDGQVLGTGQAALPSDALRTLAGFGLGPVTGQAFGGHVAEVLVHRAALSPGERAAVEMYLANKYGLYHPLAAWISGSGLAADVIDVVHANQWSLAETQAWLAFDDLFGDGAVPGVELALWLRADDGVTVDGAGRVTGWADGSGAATPSDASQALESARPELVESALGGHPVVRFDGSDDVLALPAGFADLTQGVTMMAVARPSATSRWAALVALDGAGTSYDTVALGRRGSSQDLRYSAGAQAVDGEDVWEHDVARIVGVVQQPDGTVTLVDRGESIAGGTAELPALVVRDDNTVGGRMLSGGKLWAGDIAELLVWTRALDDAERAGAEVHLADKYGLYHPGAGWIVDSGYSDSLIEDIHANHWNQADADSAAAGQ